MASLFRLLLWLALSAVFLACAGNEGEPAGNTELNVIVPNNESSPGVPAPIDIQTVEYTINCLGNSDTFLDNSASFADEVTINGNLEVVDGRTDPQGSIPPEFGTPRPGDGAEIWQGFMDLPPGPCSVQLRARDNDGEVICTATEPFTITADTTAKVNLVLYCNVSYQAPVGMVDVDATFSFNVGNFCPDLFVLNCPEKNPPTASCEVRFRDGDSSCGNGCDPQTCSATPEGLTCVPGPDPGVSTTVTCINLRIDCDGKPSTLETSCTFSGDTFGTLGGSGEGAFDVSCIPPGLGGIPGVVGTCTAVTTDGDIECNKTKVVTITCPGLSPCAQFGQANGQSADQAGGNAACEAADATVCLTSVCNNNTCDGATASFCCDTIAVAPYGTDCSAENPPQGYCLAGACNAGDCASDADCEYAGTECLVAPVGACDTATGLCAAEVPGNEGASCMGGTGTCQSGTCVDKCMGVDCSDGNECTQDVCDSSSGAAVCSNPNEPDGTSCSGGAGQCSGGTCEIPFDFAVASVAIDMCCNNNALPQQSIIPIRLDVDPGPAVAGGSFSTQFSGLLTFPESFLDVAQTVVVGGVQTADLIDAQVTVLPRGTGATGSPVPIPPIFPPGQCLIDSSSCDATLSNPDGSNPGCTPVGSFNPCQRLVTVPTTSVESECIQLDVDAGRIAGSTCTIGTDCTKQDQWNLNGFCVTGPLPIPLDTVVGNYTAGLSTDQMLFGWSDDPAATGTTYTAPNWTVPAPVFSNPLLANGLKVNASGLSVAINCVMAVENGDPLTDPVTCGLTPDSLLVGAADGSPAGNVDYTIP